MKKRKRSVSDSQTVFIRKQVESRIQDLLAGGVKCNQIPSILLQDLWHENHPFKKNHQWLLTMQLQETRSTCRTLEKQQVFKFLVLTQFHIQYPHHFSSILAKILTSWSCTVDQLYDEFLNEVHGTDLGAKFLEIRNRILSGQLNTLVRDKLSTRLATRTHITKGNVLTFFSALLFNLGAGDSPFALLMASDRATVRGEIIKEVKWDCGTVQQDERNKIRGDHDDEKLNFELVISYPSRMGTDSFPDILDLDMHPDHHPDQEEKITKANTRFYERHEKLDFWNIHLGKFSFKSTQKRFLLLSSLQEPCKFVLDWLEPYLYLRSLIGIIKSLFPLVIAQIIFDHLTCCNVIH